MNKFLILTTIFILMAMPVAAEFDLGPYLVEKTATMSTAVFYPGYLQSTDPVTLANIIAEFKHRYEFFLGITSESQQKACFNMQKRINTWLKKLQQRPEKPGFKWADDNLIFNETSPLFAMIRPGPFKTTDECSYISYGDLIQDGGVFCSYHGPDPESEFYQAHVHQFVEARPFFTAYDVTEILIFLPFVMVIPVTWLIMKRFLAG